MPDPTPPAAPDAPATAPQPPAESPKVDIAALQAELQKTREQYAQVQAALAAIQADQTPAPQAPEPPAITPEFRAQAEAFFGPFLQQMDQRFGQLAGWQSGQQLRQAAQEIDLPAEVETEVRTLMGQYENAGRPISHQTALHQVLGVREANRMRQEAANRKAKASFNTSMMPTFSGNGGLPALQPLNGQQRPADNDIAGWAKLADANDLPLN